MWQWHCPQWVGGLRSETGPTEAQQQEHPAASFPTNGEEDTYGSKRNSRKL